MAYIGRVGHRTRDTVAGERDRMIPARLCFSRLLLIFFNALVLQTSLTANADVVLPEDNGEQLTLAVPAQRIITLAPNLAELVFAAGAGRYLKAVVEYSNFPEEVTQIPRVGDAFRIDLERIVELEPDLVIAWKSGNPQTALQKLEQLGFNVWQVEISHPAEIADAVENIARAAGTLSEGKRVARQLRSKLENLKKHYSTLTPVVYFYQIAPRPLYTINGQHIISRGLEICAGRNTFADLPALAPQVSRESVVLANPQVMIAPETPGENPALSIWKDWPRLQAVENSNLIYLPADQISQATPRLLDSIELACKLLDDVRSATKTPEEP